MARTGGSQIGSDCGCGAQVEARREQDVAVFGALTAIDKDLAGLEVNVTDLDVHELACAHGSIEEQFEQDLMLYIAAVLDGPEKLF